MGTPIFKGNYGRSGSLGHGNDGAGIAGIPVQMGWGSMTGKNGDIGYIPISSILTGDINQGVFFQSEVAVDVDYTMCNPGLATSSEPAAQAATMWSNTQSIAIKDITLADPSLFTVARVTFKGDGTLYIGVR